MTRLSAEEKASRADARKNAWKIGLEERVREIVADWPPLTEAQRRVIAYNLYGIDHLGRTAGAGPSEYEMKQREEARQREEALKQAKKAAEAMTACDVCNLQPEAHRIRRANSVDMHEWQPGRAEKLMRRGTS